LGVAEIAHPATVARINRSIRFQWHSVNQFLASRNTDGTFKQIGFARVVKPIFVIAL
jgi:hypothetical protein